MYVDMFNNEDLIALRRVFDDVCGDLGLSADGADRNRREQLANTILSLARDGERDPIALRNYAVRMMRGGI
jgi:hypothetical protein